MSEIKVERYQTYSGFAFICGKATGYFHAASTVTGGKEETFVNWPSIGSVTPAEARAFAAAIIAVADAVEREGKG